MNVSVYCIVIACVLSISVAGFADTAPANAQHTPTEIVDRAIALQNAGGKAMVLDGTKEARTTRTKLAICGSKPQCISIAANLEATSKVGAWVGLADFLVRPLRDWYVARSTGQQLVGANVPVQAILQLEPDVTYAETLVQKATAEAQREADARAADQSKFQAEETAIQTATADCKTNERACRDKCNLEVDYPHCYVIGMKRLDEKKFDDATGYLKRTCDNGFAHGCNALAALGEASQNENEQREQLWSEAAENYDNLAKSRFDLEKLNKYESSSKRYAEKVHDEQSYERALIDEHVCPSRRAFVARAGAAEFQRRATDHCTNKPPTGAGYSGGSVPLPSQCRTAFATPCP
jgi:hypothetical protein